MRYRKGKLAGWLKNRSYVESIVNEQLERVCRTDIKAPSANVASKTVNDENFEHKILFPVLSQW